MKELTLEHVHMVGGGMTQGQCMAAWTAGGTLAGGAVGIGSGFFTGGISWAFTGAAASIGGVAGATVGYLACY